MKVKLINLLVLFGLSSLVWSYNPGLNYDNARNIDGTGINEALRGCVHRESGVAGKWNVDDCNYVGAHYACFNGDQWKVAQALGASNNPGEPQNGKVSSSVKSVDSSDPVKADEACKNYFGPAYFFSVPVNPTEDALLGLAIDKIIAGEKRTWVNYRSNTEDIPDTANFWLGNRTEYTNWFGSNPDNKATNGGVADCTLIHRDTATGSWQDSNCEDIHPFACYAGGTWIVTKKEGTWREGFAACTGADGDRSLFGVPRDGPENLVLKSAPIEDGASGAKYNDVWINRTDLAFEEFFISNQTRSAWWAAGQPSNRNNSDCALIDVNGDWIAEGCDGYLAYHACKLEGDAQWVLTKALSSEGVQKSVSALGFGYCKRLVDSEGKSLGAEYRPPSTKTDNGILAGLLGAVANSDDKEAFVWINYSDQQQEGFWKVANQYQDFVSLSNVEAGEEFDCGYFSLETNDKGNWDARKCFAGGLAMGYACTNGYEWKIAKNKLSDDSPLISTVWKDGFSACADAFGPDYYFAAPASAGQNSRLSLALQLAGGTKVWMNLNDAKSEGTWVANGPTVNLSPVLTTLTTQREFPEKEEALLSVTALDPETDSAAGLKYSWTIAETTRLGKDGNGLDTGINIPTTASLIDADTASVKIPPITLLNDDLYIDLQLQVTDADIVSPATTTVVLHLIIKSPLRAAYDFNTYTNPSLDRSGNGHELVFNTDVEIESHNNNLSNYFAKTDAIDSFSIDGSADTGLQLDQAKDQYTLIYRFKLDSKPTSDWASFVQKGEANFRQPGLFYSKGDERIEFNSTRSGLEEGKHQQALGSETVRLGQWMTVAYVKNGTDSKLYIDKAKLNADPAPFDEIPDATKMLTGESVGYDSGDWVFGNGPGGSEGIIGGFDDIRIYDRALNEDELDKVFGDQPKGLFAFEKIQQNGSENVVDGASTVIEIPVVRIEGDDGAVEVDYRLLSGSAVLDTDFKLKDDPRALGHADRGKGTLSWGIHNREAKNIEVELLGDALREGTESFSVELIKVPTEPDVADRNTLLVSIDDATPNPYGNIVIAPENKLVDPNINFIVDEGKTSNVVTIQRKGSDTQGHVDLTYEIRALDATHWTSVAEPGDFRITQPGFTLAPAGSGNLVGVGRLHFLDTSPAESSIKTISFDTTGNDEKEDDEIFTVKLVKLTDHTDVDNDGTGLADPDNSALLGTERNYVQIIKDITPGRIVFKDAAYPAIEENIKAPEVAAGIIERTVTLSRKGGSSGALCVEISRDASSIASDNDFTLESGFPSDGSFKNDVYWGDTNADDKTITIEAFDDNKYEPTEDLVLKYTYKANCKGATTAAPSAGSGDGFATTTIPIKDKTDVVYVKFGEILYEHGELEGNKTITIKATQAVDVNGDPDFSGSLTNKNKFTVSITPESGSADVGVDVGPIASSVTFAAGGPAEVSLSIPILDNCKATTPLVFSMKLAKSGGGSSGNLPDGLVSVTPSTTFNITNGTNASDKINGARPIAVAASPSVSGVADPAGTSGSGASLKYLVTGNGTTSGGFPSKNLKLISSDSTADSCALTYAWTYKGIAAGSPGFPSAGEGNAGDSLPGGFSAAFSHQANSIVASMPETSSFKLPFIVEDTILNYELKVSHIEGEVKTINVPVKIAANWSRLRTDASRCATSGSTITGSSTCTSSTARNFIYNPVTQQIVGQALSGGKYGCWLGVNGGNDNVRYSQCSGDAQQQFSFSGGGDNLQINGRDIVDTRSFGSWIGVRSLSGGNSGFQNGDYKHWSWTN